MTRRTIVSLTMPNEIASESNRRRQAFIERLGRLLFLHDWNKRHPVCEVFDRSGLAQHLKDAGCEGDNLDPDAYRVAVGDTMLREMGYIRPQGAKKTPRISGHSFTEAARRMLYRVEGANGRTLEQFAKDPVFRNNVRGLDVGLAEVEAQGVALANYVFARAVGEQPSIMVPKITD